jgi:glycosyltransferase involved in cell wall biosynthesis
MDLKKEIKIGLFGARADAGGLSNETFEFYRHMKPHKTVIIDIQHLNGRKNNFAMYTDIQEPHQEITIIKGFPNQAQCLRFLKNIDVLICYEIPYNYDLFKLARTAGVKTVLRFNWEFLDYLDNQMLPFPDVLASPSEWHMEEVEQKFDKKCKVTLLPNPVARDVLPFKEIKTIKNFVHVAGVELYHDRNGTQLLLDALPYIKSDINLTIFSQHQLNVDKENIPENVNYNILELTIKDYWQLYDNGDCLILPRRYGGQTLQMNEAMSRGMIPIMLDCEPNKTLLHDKCLVDTTGSYEIMTRTTIDCYESDPELLAYKIDEMATSNAKTVMELNHYSNEYADYISWEKMKLYYKKFFEAICNI